jgi:hypothetical protein
MLASIDQLYRGWRPFIPTEVKGDFTVAMYLLRLGEASAFSPRKSARSPCDRMR